MRNESRYKHASADIHHLTNLFEASSALLHVGTLTVALTRIEHLRGSAPRAAVRAAPARHVLLDGVRCTRLLVRFTVVYSDLEQIRILLFVVGAGKGVGLD